MRADNSRHVIQAARRRAQHTRQRAVAALRRMDTAGQRITFNAVSREARVSRSWLYAQEDLRAEIERLRDRHPAPLHQRQFLPSGSAHQSPRCCAAWRRPPPGSAVWRPTTSTCARRWPEPSENAERPTWFGQTDARDTPKRSSPKLIGPC